MRRENLYLRSSLGTDGFFEFVEGLGGDPVALMQDTRLEAPRPKDKIQFISWNAICRYFEVISKTLDEPYLGLKWALAQPKDYRVSGPTLFLSSIASNLRHFGDLAIEYQKLHTNGVAYSYEEDIEVNEAIFVVAIHPHSVPCRQFCEQILGGIAVIRKHYLPHIKFNRVTFQHSAPDDLSLYNEIFDCPLEFNAERNTITCDQSYMEMSTSNDKIAKIVTPALRYYFNWKIDKHPHMKRSTEKMITEILPNILGINRSDIGHVADVLNMHPKKLQRVLQHEGVSYSEVLDNVRQGLAERLLIESDISIGRIAKMLDYSSDRAFNTAVNRWFGMSSTKYRHQFKHEFEK